MSSKVSRVTLAALPDPMNPRLPSDESTLLVDPDLVGDSQAQRALIGLTRAVSSAAVREDQLAQLQQAVDSVNDYIRATQTSFSIRFEVHQRSGLTYALIRNAETGRVLKQIPAQVMLNIAARVKHASGILVDLAT